jgi:hypothetical protein
METDTEAKNMKQQKSYNEKQTTNQTTNNEN